MTDLTSWIESHSSSFQGKISFNEALKNFTYYRLGGPARVVISPKSVEDLHWIATLKKELNPSIFVLGNGSNLLISDSGFDGVIIRTHQLNQELSLLPPSQFKAGASVPILKLLRFAGEQGVGNVEKLCGVPGTVGGAVVMNAGTFLGETKDFIESVGYFDFSNDTLQEVQVTEQDFSYRRNLFLPENAIVVSAIFSYVQKSPDEVKNQIKALLEKRSKTQPVDQPSCGSVFKNPKTSKFPHAWQVIEALGLRGYRSGGAWFSEKHPNFIVHDGVASAQDVYDLIQLAKRRAIGELGLKLEEEVKFVGNWMTG